MILVHERRSGVLGIARYATRAAPLASSVGPPLFYQSPDSIHALIAGRTRVVFVWDVAEAPAIGSVKRGQATSGGWGGDDTVFQTQVGFKTGDTYGSAPS
jgi:hypothetical protein